ncbi:hypothetical protein GCM10007320_02880 [Pseudorhodoferax aquiterrae]|uniref:DUF6285 domain-containing protein n=1 Tax=Pseudorhodoferax aquiterrae TaxID=747304 RepID=A0ABQ3FUQ2_9BURK|nr:DUF6285 domain-containing protein [Pseudorhodoferax aquiterrae]GHC69437.1 hypothetical protein GCM10007320_02880 [Pseudorhodoferax aquiterrae]
MQDRPHAPELLQAVVQFLRDRVLPATEGALAYQVRVAANALAIAQRQVEQGADAQARELEGLRALLGAGAPTALEAANRLLCERIAAGAMDLATPGLLAHLQATTAAKLAIDQPGYSDEP